jgi:hypothetical protein
MKTFNVQEAAEYLKCSVDTVMAIPRDELPRAKIGKCLVFTDLHLDAYLLAKIEQSAKGAKPRRKREHEYPELPVLG